MALVRYFTAGPFGTGDKMELCLVPEMTLKQNI